MRNNVRVFCECRAESVDSAGVPTGNVQCEVYPPDVGGYHFPEVKKPFSLGIIEPTETFGGEFVQSVGRGIDDLRENADGMGDSTTGVTLFCA